MTNDADRPFHTHAGRVRVGDELFADGAYHTVTKTQPVTGPLGEVLVKITCADAAIAISFGVDETVGIR